MMNIMWRGYLSRSALKAHERWARRGQQGAGRLVLEGCDLRDAYVPHPHLVAARFVRCDLTGANFRIGNLSQIELRECIWNGGLLEMAKFNKAIIENCQFVGAYLNVANFVGTQIRGGTWSQVDLHNTMWDEAVVQDVCFQNARFEGAVIKNTRFVGCDFRGANLAEVEYDNSIFLECDLRETNMEIAKLNHSLLQRCKTPRSSAIAMPTFRVPQPTLHPMPHPTPIQ